jgi:hypothetical protein
VVAIMLYRRRKLLSSNGTATQSENGTVDRQRGVLGWLRGVNADAKAPTITTDETPSSPYDEDNPYLPQPQPQEIGGGQVHEMMGLSPSPFSLPSLLSFRPHKTVYNADEHRHIPPSRALRFRNRLHTPRSLRWRLPQLAQRP